MNTGIARKLVLATFGTLTLAGHAAAQGDLEAQRIPHPLGDAFLFVPPDCPDGCPLVIVSHSRGMSAEKSLTRPHLRNIFEQFARQGFAVLVSHDAGTNTWGQPATLKYLEDVHEQATRRFAFNNRTYTLGYSMGGLPALLARYKTAFPVAGVLLLDGTVNLEAAYGGSDVSRRNEIAKAHGIKPGEPLPAGADPLNDHATAKSDAPLFVAGSLGDKTVPFLLNGLALYRSTPPEMRRLLLLKGPHLGGSHFGEPVVTGMLRFLLSEEARARLNARQP